MLCRTPLSMLFYLWTTVSLIHTKPHKSMTKYIYEPYVLSNVKQITNCNFTYHSQTRNQGFLYNGASVARRKTLYPANLF